jgi:hypothetical protein
VEYPVSTNVWGGRWELYAHVADAWTKPVNEGDPFGEIRGGAIRVECSVLLAGHFTEHKLEDFELAQYDATWVSEAGYKLRAFKDTLQEFDGTDRYSCFLLPLIAAQYTYEFSIPYPVRGIIIRRTNQVKGEFQRVGSFAGNHYDSVETDAFVHELDRRGRVTARAECGEVIENTEHPNETFVITIV